jgi:hypothetical protein
VINLRCSDNHPNPRRLFGFPRRRNIIKTPWRHPLEPRDQRRERALHGRESTLNAALLIYDLVPDEAVYKAGFDWPGSSVFRTSLRELGNGGHALSVLGRTPQPVPMRHRPVPPFVSSRCEPGAARPLLLELGVEPAWTTQAAGNIRPDHDPANVVISMAQSDSTELAAVRVADAWRVDRGEASGSQVINLPAPG